MRKLALLAAMVILGVEATAAAAASSPTVTTGGVSSVGQATTTLHGSVNPNGSATAYYFQWGLTAAYTAGTAPRSAGSGTRSVAVTGKATGLLPGTVYHYRLVAQNGLGLTAGKDRTFKTAGHPLPGAFTGSPTGVTGSSATATGTIVTNGVATSYQFEWGSAAGVYTTLTPLAQISGSSTPTPVSALIAPVGPGTTIHYRLIAYRAGFAPSTGVDAEFTTLPSRRPFPTIRGRTTPHRDRHSPFVFTTTGTVSSSAFPAAAECNGSAIIRFFVGSRVVSYQLVTVQPNCTFSSQVRFTHKFKVHGVRPRVERLRVAIQFLGNSYLSPAHARAHHVFMG